MDILKMKPEEMAGLAFHCGCGNEHQVDIKRIVIREGAVSQLCEVIDAIGGRRIFLIDDENTHAVAGEQVEKLLSGRAFHTKTFPGMPLLVPDEFAIGGALAAMEPEDDLILAVGSGVLNDLSRIISSRTGKPYIIVGTAPSMDGYASTVSPLILDEQKITKEAVYPAAILTDITILKDAPEKMMTAGFGDIIGKFTANADWRLSRQLNGEYFCDTCAELVNKAVEKCAENAEALKRREAHAVKSVTEALVLSGVAMGLIGNSRPASGAEHHFSHFWEVEALKNHESHELHGNSVAVGAVVSASLYELAADHLPEGFVPPDKQRILDVLHAAGAPSDPKEIGISRALFHHSILHAMEIRERYTILRFCDAHGLLPEFADILTQRFYGN